MGKKTSQVLLHVICCLAFLSLPVLFSPDLSSSMEFIRIPFFQMDFIDHIAMILIFYFNYYFLVPNFILQKKYILSAFWIVIAFCTLMFAHLLIPVEFPDPPGVVPSFKFQSENFFIREIWHHLFQFLTIFGFSFLLKIYIRWKQAEKEKISAELSYLKAQINPHFLFNTLNSIYSLALEKSDDTAPAVVKLSGMMRYVISEAHHDFVPLEKEISYISNYIELQRIRLGNTTRIDYFADINTGEKEIAPLLLIPFIENAFKYGVNAEDNSLIQVRITLSAGDELMLEVHNNKVVVKKDETEQTGLGIQNTKKRLDLLYPGLHILEIKDREKEFIVLLTLKLR